MTIMIIVIISWEHEFNSMLLINKWGLPDARDGW